MLVRLGTLCPWFLLLNAILSFIARKQVSGVRFVYENLFYGQGKKVTSFHRSSISRCQPKHSLTKMANDITGRELTKEVEFLALLFMNLLSAYVGNEEMFVRWREKKTGIYLFCNHIFYSSPFMAMCVHVFVERSNRCANCLGFELSAVCQVCEAWLLWVLHWACTSREEENNQSIPWFKVLFEVAAPWSKWHPTWSHSSLMLIHSAWNTLIIVLCEGATGELSWEIAQPVG